MQYSILFKYTLSAFFAVILFALAAPLAFAQTSVEASQEVRAEVTGEVRPHPLPLEKALDLRDRLIQKKEDSVEKFEDRKENMEDRREEARNRLEDRKSEIKNRITDHVKVRIDAFVEAMAKRFRAAIGRLETFAERLESRLSKLAERGIDTTEADRLLDVAISLTAEAKVDIEMAIESAGGITVSDTPREALQEAKRLFAEAKKSLSEALKAYRDVVVAIKTSVNLEAETTVDSVE